MNLKLLVLQGRPQGKSILFPRGEYLFGRGPECHIQPNSDWVSRQHCLLRVRDDAAFIRDLGSRNGTLVNGERVVGERRLDEGDKLQVGPLVFEVRFEGATLPAAAEAPSSSQVPTSNNINVQDTAEQPAVGAAAKPVPEQTPAPEASPVTPPTAS